MTDDKKTEEEKNLDENKSKKLEELENTLKHFIAEFDNYRKRVEKEMEEQRDLGKAEIIKDQLSVIDEFEIALQKINENDREGIKMIYLNLLKVLQNHGLREIEASGKIYDPYLHEVVGIVKSNEDGKIVEVVKKGYLFKDRVLRASQVIIGAQEKNNNDNKGDKNE